MKKVTKNIALYICEVCGTNYESREGAEKCEAMPVEEKVFRVGNMVRNLVSRECRTCYYKFYLLEGKVSIIIGPKPADLTFPLEGFNSTKRPVSHVFQYLAEFSCQHCYARNRIMFFAPELELVRR